ncbi:MAG: PAS domain S-box protein [Methanomicrobia archaeon]|nr:PAS domain S-box protein [Methanomicrobia archaeon]
MPLPEAQREITILHVDDEPAFLALTKAFLEREQEHFVVDTATSVEEALTRLDERSYNIIVSDFQMPGLDGLTLLQQVRERSSTIPFIVFTGKGREEVAIEALNRGANYYLQKGSDIASMYGTLIYAIEEVVSKHRALEALRESQARYKELADSLPQVVFEADERGTLTFVNRNAFDVFGYTEAEFENGLNALQMIVPEDQARATRNMQRVLKGASIGGIEYTALRKDGSTFPVSIHTSRILRDSKPVGLRGVLIDQTARKQVEDALVKRDELYRLLTEESPFGVAIIYPDGRYGYVNSTFVKLFGYTLEDIPTGRAWFTKAFPDDSAREAARSAWIADLKASQPGQFRPRSFAVTCKDGSQKMICFRSVTLSTGEQLVLYEDSTAQKRAETERAAILKELSAKNRELERFTYTVSHDLRSPLVTIEGFTDMLQKDLEQTNHKRVMSDLRYISTAAARMDELLSATLKLSRIGRMTNPLEDIPFGTLIQDAVAQTAGEIQASGAELTVADQFPTVHVDRLGVIELLVNLISNSIKYRGDRPDPKIELGHRMDSDGTVFFVKDNGIGIAKVEQEKVFEIFYQVDRRSEGTGAGLAIVRRIVEMHGGRIWIESELGNGCTVCFTLPVVGASKPLDLSARFIR